MSRFVFTGKNLKEISFPLGGIGTGSLGLSGTGRLVDWEIFNRPAKGSLNGFSHFAIKAERHGAVLDARVMNADLPPPYTGSVHSGATFSGYDFGPDRHLMTGVPHFKECTFTGTYPFAKVEFIDPSFPGRVELNAFNPLIPANDMDSSLPAAFFEARIENPTSVPIDYTLCLSIANPYAEGGRCNRYEREGAYSMMRLGQYTMPEDDIRYGDLCFGVKNEPDISQQEYWYRGAWFDNLGVFWQDFCRPGALKPHGYAQDDAPGQVNEDVASLAVRVSVAPGESRSVRFVLAWNQPNNYNDWSAHAGARNADGSYRTWKNYYATLFQDSAATARYALDHWDRLEADSRLYLDTMLASALPEEALDAVLSNISLLKSPTVWRLEDGTFYGWEGVMTDKGSCEGSCTHVWNYTYALPFLFPALERSMREADYQYNLRPDGGMPFRLQLPLGSGQSNFRPCVDGQMGGVIKTYREWRILGDDQWLRSVWPSVKRSLEYAWSPLNKD